MLQKVNNIKGLNKRHSDLNRNPEYASDLQNVELTSRRELVKRYGYDLDLTSSGIIDVIESVSQSKLLFIKSDGIYEDIAGVLTKIPFSGDGTTFTGIVDYDEYDDIVYITDTTLNNYPYKYDGERVYRAGMPQVTVNSVTNGTGVISYDLYYRVFFVYGDAGKNPIFGDYYQTDKIATANAPVFNIDTLLGTEFPHSNVGPSCTPIGILIAGSANKTFGYTFFENAISPSGPSLFTVDHTGATDSIDTNTAGTSWFSTNTPLEDVYDSTIVKGLPPLAKYVTVYGSTMVMGNIFNDGTLDRDTANTVMWSDTGVGSTVETFPPFNKEVVGKTSEGNISGLFGSTNELTVLKEKQVYYINGILVGRGFRLRSSLSAGIGCVSHKSIIETEDGCLFQSSKGIYFAGGGGKPSELSDLIEPIFTEDTTGLDLTKCRAIRDTKSEKLYFYIPASSSVNSITLVWDYYHKEWFLHKNIIADSGLIMLGDDMYHSNGTSLYKRNSSYNDAGSAIEAFYKSGWWNLGSPSIRKKFVNFIMHSIGSVVWSLGLKTQVDWIDADKTDVSIDFSATISNDDHKLNNGQYNSIRFDMSNSTVNEGMLITGYEFEWESTQRKPKGES